MKISQFIRMLPKTLYFNMKMFPLKTALKLPVFVASSVKLDSLARGCIKINAPLRRGMIKFGSGGSEGIPGYPVGHIIFKKGASVTFNGKALFALGSTLRVDGTAVFGDNFYCNKFCYISCSKSMEFGNDVLIGWCVNIRDSDGHTIYGSDGVAKEKGRDVRIGNHVWICAHADVLRSSIADESVVAWGSKVLRSFDETSSLIGGYPANVIARNVRWED